MCTCQQDRREFSIWFRMYRLQVQFSSFFYRNKNPLPEITEAFEALGLSALCWNFNLYPFFSVLAGKLKVKQDLLYY